MKSTLLSRLLALASLVALAAFSPIAAFAAEYYVATTGADTNAGTLAAPFASLAKAQTVAVSGDTVWVRGGTYTTFAIAATDANYNYVHRFNKSGLTWSAYPGETPLFDFSSVPTDRRVCGFHVTGNGLVVRGFHVTGVKVGTQKQSECFRIDGSAAYVDLYDCAAYNNEANGFYFTNRSRGSCIRCDAYNNIGPTGDSVGNTDGFGAHGNGVAFRYCRAWNNSDDGYDCISSDGSNTFDHCWAYNMRAGGDSNGFKVGGYGSGSVPATVPVHTVSYCLAANNNAHGFYANHQPAQAAVWTFNTAYNHSNGNFNMLERVSSTDATDIPGYREILHQNVSFAGTIIKNDANPAANVTNNSWTNGATVDATDFLSLDATQMILPRGPGNNLPFLTFMHLAPGSDLAGLGCFQPPPPAPTNLAANWTDSTHVALSWTASPGATEYYLKRATTSGGPYTTVAVRLSGTTFTDASVIAGTTYFYRISAMDAVSYDESVSSEVVATIPPVAITSIDADTGRSATDAITSDTTLVLHGTAKPNQTLSFSRSGAGTIGTDASDAAGNWSFDYSATVLADGSYSFQVTTTTAGEPAFTSDAFVVVVDTIAPAAPVVLSAGSDPITVTGTAEPFASVAVTIDGSVAAGDSIANAAGNWSVTYPSPIAAGPHSFTAIATDIAGNVGPASSALEIDTRVTMPVIVAVQSDAGALSSGSLTSDKTLLFAGTAGASNTVTLTRAGVGVIGSVPADGSGNWTFDYTAVALPEGTHSFTATGNDGVGSSSASLPFAITIDSIAPTVLSSVRFNPNTATITSAIPAVVFRVTFSEPVSGVDATDFTLTATGTAAGSVASVTAVSATIFDVTANSLSGVGTLRLDLNASGTGIVDATGNVAAGFTGGETYNRVLSVAGSGIWTQENSGGLWTDAPNWQDAIIPNGSTHAANFATLDLNSDTTVQLDAARTVNSLTFGDTDTDTAASWILGNNGNVANTLTLAGTVPTITVNALGTGATTTIAARLAGSGGLTKAGPGTLVLSGANTLSGAVALTAGALRLDAGGTLSMSTLGVSSTNAQVFINGGSLTASGLVSLGQAGTRLQLDSGSATLNGGVRFTADSPTVRINGGTFSTADITVVRSNSSLTYTNGVIFAGGTSTMTTINLGTGNSWGSMSVEGGTVTASGQIVVGNQTTATRGGGFRVTGGTFNSTNSGGLVLSRMSGTNANNVAEAVFTGGLSTLEKLTFGFNSSVTAGSGTFTINGGTVYLGSGGIVKSGTAGMTSTINLTNGLLGAKAAWTTTHPVVFGNAIQLNAANASATGFDFSLSGGSSGAGGFTKTGAGKLTLGGANNFSGAATVSAGTLEVTGSIGAGSTLTVGNGASLTGAGSIARNVQIDAGGTALAPVNASAMTWSPLAKLQVNPVAGTRLVLTGALTQSVAGDHDVVINGSPVAGNTYVIATFGSTNLTTADLRAVGATGYFTVGATQITFTAGDYPRAAYDAWAASLPYGFRSPTADPDGDGVSNLLEFLTGGDALQAGTNTVECLTILDGGIEYPAIRYTRRIARGGVTANVQVAPEPAFGSELGSQLVSAVPAAAGFEIVTVRSLLSLADQPRQFLRVSAAVAAP